MSGMITISGNYYDIGREIGRYWGGYFSSLKIASKTRLGKNHHELFNQYKKYLSDSRRDTKILQQNVKYYSKEIWEETEGMLAGVNEYKKELGFKTELGGIFSCILGETDTDYRTYCGCCSTATFKDKNGYYMIHSDENDKIYPLVTANVTLNVDNQTKHFTSVSHPFQLFGSAAGLNEYFAFQGNSIFCTEDIFDNRYKSIKGINRIPKTVLSRKLLELETLEDVESLYRDNRSTLPNHHIIISRQGVYSLKIKPVDEVSSTLKKIPLKMLKLFCHTNHFKDEDDKKWSYNENKESKDRLKALEQYVTKAKDYLTLQKSFLNFINEYEYKKVYGKLLKYTSGIFCFRIPYKGIPYLQKTFLNYGYSNNKNSWTATYK